MTHHIDSPQTNSETFSIEKEIKKKKKTEKLKMGPVLGKKET